MMRRSLSLFPVIILVVLFLKHVVLILLVLLTSGQLLFVKPLLLHLGLCVPHCIRLVISDVIRVVLDLIEFVYFRLLLLLHCFLHFRGPHRCPIGRLLVHKLILSLQLEIHVGL
jgi:hypothetical protein